MDLYNMICDRVEKTSMASPAAVVSMTIACRIGAYTMEIIYCIGQENDIMNIC